MWSINLQVITVMSWFKIVLTDSTNGLGIYFDGHRLTEEQHMLRIFEAAPPNTSITSVSVGYLTQTAQNETFDIWLSGRDAEHFAIVNMAIVTTQQPQINRPLNANYSIIVEARTSQDTTTSATVSVTILVSKRNIFAPQLPFSSKTIENAYQKGRTQMFDILHTNATDPDPQDYNRKTQFSLECDGKKTWCADTIASIDRGTGIISTKRDLTIGDVDKVYHAILTVRNRGIPQLYSTAKLSIVFRAFSAVRQISTTTLPNGTLVCFHPPQYGRTPYYSLQYRKLGSAAIGSMEIRNSNWHSYGLICRKLFLPDSSSAYKITIWAHDGNRNGVKTWKWTRKPMSTCQHNTCRNQGTCYDSWDSFHCVCAPGYAGRRCNVSACDTITCLNNGTCSVSRSGRPLCACLRGYSGLFCGTRATCHSVTTSIGGTSFKWSTAPFNTKQKIKCPTSEENSVVDGYITRECKLVGNTTFWSTVSGKCPKVLSVARALTGLRQTKTELSDTRVVSYKDILRTINIVEEAAELATKNFEVARAMVDVVDDMMNVDYKTVAVNNTGNRVRKIVEYFCQNLQLNTSQSLEFRMKNFRVKVQNVNTTTAKEASMKTLVKDNTTLVSDITIPKEALDFANDTRLARISFVYYINSNLFVNETNNMTADAGVITGSIGGVRVDGLNGCVTYILRNEEAGRRYTCVYWDEYGGRWSSDGVKSLTTGGVTTTCCSKHLTSFSMLLDPDPDTIISDLDDVILTVLSYCGCSLSMLGLMMTLITYMLFRYLSKDQSGQILVQLCASMLLMNMAYVIASVGEALPTEICIAAGVAVHFFVLSTFLWMAAEAYNMYRMLITVFKTNERLFILKRCAFAWGVPLIPVITCIAMGTSHYQTAEKCGLTNQNPYLYYGAYIAPVCLMLVLNAVVFLLVVKVLLTPRFDQVRGENKISPSQIRGVLTVMVMLGTSWIFGILQIGSVKVAFQYVFVVLNSGQGFLIFVFRCFNHPEVKDAWKQLFYDGTLKTRRGKLKTSGQAISSSCTSNETMARFKSKQKSTEVHKNNRPSRNHNSCSGHTKHTEGISMKLSNLSGRNPSAKYKRNFVFVNRGYDVESSFSNLENLPREAKPHQSLVVDHTEVCQAGDALCLLNAYKSFLEKEDRLNNENVGNSNHPPIPED